MCFICSSPCYLPGTKHSQIIWLNIFHWPHLNSLHNFLAFCFFFFKNWILHLSTTATFFLLRFSEKPYLHLNFRLLVLYVQDREAHNDQSIWKYLMWFYFLNYCFSFWYRHCIFLPVVLILLGTATVDYFFWWGVTDGRKTLVFQHDQLTIFSFH